jgi:hypothetical protein
VALKHHSLESSLGPESAVTDMDAYFCRVVFGCFAEPRSMLVPRHESGEFWTWFVGSAVPSMVHVSRLSVADLRF